MREGVAVAFHAILFGQLAGWLCVIGGFQGSSWQVQSLAFVLAALSGMVLWRAPGWLKELNLGQDQKVSLADERMGVN